MKSNLSSLAHDSNQLLSCINGADASGASAPRPAVGQRELFEFKLYVSGDLEDSREAIANLATLCRAHLPQRHRIEIVDVLRQPARALADRIYLTPTLVKLSPKPIRQIIGTLSQTQTVLRTLGIDGTAT